MKNSKNIFAYLTIANCIITNTAQANKIDEALMALPQLVECDGSKKAEDVCKQHCTADGILLEGTCGKQAIWYHCSTRCRQDWISDCAQTALKNNLEGLPKCQ